jgi:DNA-binding CsgD family transcriptional regulator
VLLDVYPLALASSIHDFEPRLFELLRLALPFDSACMGRVALTADGPVLHNGFLFRQPPELMVEWEANKRDDPLLAVLAAGLGQSEAVVVATSDVSSATFTQAIRAFVVRFSITHALACIFEDRVLGLHYFISLYRTCAESEFEPRDKELMRELLPHLASAININRVHHIDQIRLAASAPTAAAAICDGLGVLQHADRAFGAMMREEWPAWSGPALPACVDLGHAGRVSPGYCGARVAFKVERIGDLVVVRARKQSPADSLSPRQRSVAQLFAGGLTYKEVARRLAISPSTVRHHLRHVYETLGVHDKCRIASLLGTAGEA